MEVDNNPTGEININQHMEDKGKINQNVVSETNEEVKCRPIIHKTQYYPK